MKRLVISGKVLIVALTICFFLVADSVKAEASFKEVNNSGSKMAANSISGVVWNPYNQPVSDVNVELMNEFYMTIARQRTLSGGRYVFNNIPSGVYKVKVLTIGTDYLEQVQEAQIINIFRGDSDNVYLDFHLKFDPRKVTLGSGGAPEEIFVQEGISDEARRRYKKGVELLADKKDKGLAEIEQALQISPNFYQALSRLGAEYVERKEYAKSLPYLVKAIDINQRSYSSFYALAYACYQLNQITEAVEAARAAAVLKPASINSQLLYGTVLRINGNYDKSEKALQQAKNLSKKTPVAEIHWQLALLYNKLERNKEAAAELETYLKIQPNSPNKKEVEDLIGKLKTAKK